MYLFSSDPARKAVHRQHEEIAEHRAGCRALPCVFWTGVVCGLVTAAGSPGKSASHAEVLFSGHIWEFRLVKPTPDASV